MNNMEEENNLIPINGLEYLANINSKFSVISEHVNRYSLPENFSAINNTISTFSNQLSQSLSPLVENINLVNDSFSTNPLLDSVGGINTKISSLLDSTRSIDVNSLIADSSSWAIKPLDSLKIGFKIPEVKLPNHSQFQFNLESDTQRLFKISEVAEMSTIKFGSSVSLAFNNPLINLETQNLLNVESNLYKNLELNRNSQDIISKYNFDHLQGSISLVPELIKPLKNTLEHFSTSYNAAFEPLTIDINSYLSVSPRLTSGGVIEYFNNSSLYETVIEETIEVPINRRVLENQIEVQNQEEVPILLEKVNPDLMAMWKGAVSAIDSNNPDKVRHFSVSMRELITHVIHTLAPDNKIKEWTTDPVYFHNKRPTRKARLNYICREIATGSFSDFMENDITSIIKMVDLFHAGTHKTNSDLSNRQLIVLKRRVESSIKYLIEITMN
jgi:hypothetical protein